MGLIDDHQIPRRREQILKTLAVVSLQLLQTPAAPPLQRLDRIQRADHLVMLAPQVVVRVRGRLAEGRQFRGLDKAEGLAKMQVQLRLPLPHQPLRRHDQDALDQAAQLQLAQDQASLDGLAETHLIRQQVAHPRAADRALQGIELMRQRHHAGVARRQQQVVRQCVQHLGRGRGVQDLRQVGGGAR